MDKWLDPELSSTNNTVVERGTLLSTACLGT